MREKSKRNSIATVELIEKTGQVRNEDYRAECYGVFTKEMDYWFTGLVSVCHTLAKEKFQELKQAEVPCELVNAMADEVIDAYRM
jgi:hypothetical protein